MMFMCGLIMGLTLDLVEAFTKPLKLILSLARVDNMGEEVSLADTSTLLLERSRWLPRKSLACGTS